MLYMVECGFGDPSREAEWNSPSFTAELFKGNFCWDLLHPYPVQSPEDKKIGDDYHRVDALTDLRIDRAVEDQQTARVGRVAGKIDRRAVGVNALARQRRNAL